MVLHRTKFEGPLHWMNSFLINSFAVAKLVQHMLFPSTDETKGSEGEHNTTITQEHQTDEKVAPCCATVSFTDDDLLLGSKLHNRTLFVVGSIREQRLNRVRNDGCSVVNIMPKVF